MRISCAGDSLTRGVSFTRNRLRIVRETYPSRLETFLHEKVHEEIEVKNCGVFNDNSDSLLMRLQKDVLVDHPDIVLIEIGANDCDFRWHDVSEAPDIEHSPYVPVDRYMNNMEQITRLIERSGAKPIVFTLLPLDPVRYYRHLAARFGTQIAHWIAECGGIEYWHHQYDQALRRCLDALQVDCIDVCAEDGQAGTWRSMLSDDGIHLTATGYECLAQTVCSSLQVLGSVASMSLTASADSRTNYVNSVRSSELFSVASGCHPFES